MLETVISEKESMVWIHLCKRIRGGNWLQMKRTARKEAYVGAKKKELVFLAIAITLYVTSEEANSIPTRIAQ